VAGLVRIKICGVTSVEDARLCVELGVEAIGLNFISRSPRVVDDETARDIVHAVRGKAMLVGVTADADAERLAQLRDAHDLDCLQLHGDEPPDVLARLLPHAYKAIRVGNDADVSQANRFGGDYILVDAPGSDGLGGTGKTFDWTLVCALAARRKVTLAGGLHAGNVAEAIAVVHPYCVDVASGVEMAGQPRRKDPERLRAFVRAVRAA
jgi:phosphoribosylanthranilate isomerase